MKYRPKNAKQAIVIVVIVVTAVLLMNVWGIGTNRTGYRMGYVSNNGWSDWVTSYAFLNGTLDHTIHPKATPETYYIQVETESGNLSIQIMDKDGNTIFSETDIGSEIFSIEVQGNFSVHITAHNHKGGFSITTDE